jgi:hypothetical protein
MQNRIATHLTEVLNQLPDTLPSTLDVATALQVVYDLRFLMLHFLDPTVTESSAEYANFRTASETFGRRLIEQHQLGSQMITLQTQLDQHIADFAVETRVLLYPYGCVSSTQ